MDQYQEQHNDEPMNYVEGMDSTGTEATTMQQLAQKHDQYADEIEKIKMMLGDEWLSFVFKPFINLNYNCF